MDEDDLSGDAREVEGVGGCRVAPADHDDRLVPVGHAVAGCAVVDPAAGELPLAFDAEAARLRARRDDDRPSEVGRAVARLHLLDVPVEADAADLGELGRRPEALGPQLHLLAEVEPVDAVLETGVVVDLRGERDLSAGRELLEHERVEAGPRRVQGGRVPGGSSPYDEDIVNAFHVGFLLASLGANAGAGAGADAGAAADAGVSGRTFFRRAASRRDSALIRRLVVQRLAYELLDLRDGTRADDGARRLAALEDHEGRDGADAVALGQLGHVVDVDLRGEELSREPVGDLVERGAEPAAVHAPRRVEIDERGELRLQDLGVEVVRCGDACGHG